MKKWKSKSIIETWLNTSTSFSKDWDTFHLEKWDNLWTMLSSFISEASQLSGLVPSWASIRLPSRRSVADIRSEECWGVLLIENPESNTGEAIITSPQVMCSVSNASCACWHEMSRLNHSDVWTDDATTRIMHTYYRRLPWCLFLLSIPAIMSIVIVLRLFGACGSDTVILGSRFGQSAGWYNCMMTVW